MSTIIKKSSVGYELWHNEKLVATCTNLNTANHLMMLELNKELP